MELILASLVTNIAIQLIQKVGTELDLLIERPKKYPTSLYHPSTFPGIMMYEAHQHLMDDANRNLDSFLHLSERVQIFDCPHSKMCLWEIFTALRHFFWESQTKPKVKGTYNLLSGSVDFVGGRDVSATWIRIRRILLCLQAVSGATRRSFASDEITAGIGVMFRTGTVPLGVVCGVQLLLEV